MEKDDPSDNEQENEVVPEPETISAVKPKRKVNLTDEERAKRSERMRKVALARIQKSRAVNAQVADKVKAIHKEAVQKGKAVRMKKALEIQHPDSDSDSDSSVELVSSKKKRKNSQPVIIIKNYSSEPKKKYKDAEAPIQEQIYKPEPIVEQPRVKLGYFV
jgi:hypothetical protein